MDWKPWEAEYHGKFGQPPVHPSVMCRVLLFALIRRIRSSRQIEYNLKHSIDFMWLASGRSIDHTTLSEFRRKHPKQLIALDRQMVQLAVQWGVAKLSELCIDGTRVLANASRFNTLTAKKVEQLLSQLDEQITAAMREMETNDALDGLFNDGQPADQLPAELADMKSRQEQLNAALNQLREMDKQAFIYNEENDCFHCPAGKPLPRGGIEKVQRCGMTIERMNYRCRESVGCPLIERCRRNVKANRGRRVTRDGYEAIRRRHSDRMQEADAKDRYKRRLHFGETPFAVLKAAIDLRRFLLRGHEGVQQEWLWGCTALNLKKLVSLWGGLRAKLDQGSSGEIEYQPEAQAR